MALDALSSATEEFRNVLYFCSFDRSTSLTGKEILLTGSGEPLMANTESEVEKLFQSFTQDGERHFPIVISFDFASYIYPNVQMQRSGLPLCISFEPEEQHEGIFSRQRGEMEKTIGHDFHDRPLEGRIRESRDRIRAGELLQVVLSRRFDLPESSLVDLVDMYLHSDTSRYVFYFQTDDIVIVGSSPENLVSRNRRSLEISTIAGTIRRSESRDEDLSLSDYLKNSDKDRLEHRMLVDLARNDLGKVSVPGSVKVLSSMKLRRYKSVQHLVSLTGSVLKTGLGNLDLIKATFPAGTVSGAPKERALRLISQYETVPRGFYSGAIGVVSKETLDLALLIRSVFSVGSEIYSQAGAGIVKDSNPEKEIQEMYDKVLSVSGGVLSENVDNRQP